MLRRVLAMVFVTFSLVAVVTQSPANAACTVDFGVCTGGNCAVNVGDCVNGGNCELNLGYCGTGGSCTVNVGTCYGNCVVNLGGYCGATASCLVIGNGCRPTWIVDPTICPALAALSGPYGAVYIDSEGDVFVSGVRTQDCPPYQS